VGDLTIGQLAKAANVPISTVRFYERRGLIRPDSRTRSNYRTFTPQTLERLRFIRAAQSSGFSLRDVREMLGLTHFDEPPCEEVGRLIENRLSDVRQRVKELRRVEKMLTKALQSCCKGGPDWCTRIERLKGGNAVCKKPSRKALTLH
jgi:MerR family mercuric resistance operon transcriptional regulator